MKLQAAVSLICVFTGINIFTQGRMGYIYNYTIMHDTQECKLYVNLIKSVEFTFCFMYLTNFLHHSKQLTDGDSSVLQCYIDPIPWIYMLAFMYS